MQAYVQRQWVGAKLTGCLVVFAILLLSACQPIQPPADNTTATIPEVTIEVNETEFVIPDNFPGGIVRVTIQNTSNKDLDVGISRLREGTNVDEVMALGQDANANLVPILQQISMLISFNPVAAGGSQQAILDLGIGDFMLDATEHVEGEPPPGLPRYYGLFSTTAIVGTVEPQSAVLVEMTDFAYIMPDEIMAGKQLWQYHNTGTQWHMQFFLKPAPGATLDDVMAAMMSEGEPSGPPPFEFVPNAGLAPISEGERVWLEFALEPGEYLVGCPIPDMVAMLKGEAPKPHIAQGMHRLLTVK